jgi:broad specificity phosphatase PhoE
VRGKLALLVSILLLVLAGVFLIPSGPRARKAHEETVVLLVRHAERADDGPGDPQVAMDRQMAQDPPLSEAGRLRSSLLAELLRDAGITRIHSTDYRRTRETADPTSAATGVEVAIYDPSDLDAFAEELRSSPGRHLVVGHSNTTPELVAALGGDPGLPMESLEYDRLYVVTLEETGASTVLLRFGEPFVGSGRPGP